MSPTRILQGLIGIFFLGLGYAWGHEHFDLICSGIKTEGIIVAYKEVHSDNSGGKKSNSFFMFAPIVEFHTGQQVIRFQNWSGNTSQGGLGSKVPVLYDAANPQSAIIDQALMNWYPWGPVFLLGVFLSLACVFGKRFPGNSKV